MPMSIGSFFTPWWVVEEAEEGLREGERWPPPGNYNDHVDHLQSDDGIDNHNNWMGRRKRQERVASPPPGLDCKLPPRLAAAADVSPGATSTPDPMFGDFFSSAAATEILWKRDINSCGSKYCSQVIKYTRHWVEKRKN